MNIVLAANECWMEHLAVTIVSILKNSDKADEFKFYIFSNDINEKTRKHLLQLKKIKDFEIEFLDISDDDFSELPTRLHYTKQMYYRLKIPEYVNADRALYLDTDIIVRKSLRELYFQDLGDSSAAVVEDIMIGRSAGYHPHQERVVTENYFNSGMILWNINKIKNENLCQRAVDFVVKEIDNFRYYDQDALNKTFDGACIWLDKKFNFQYNPGYRFVREKYDEIKDLIVVLHFVSDQKPWNLRPRIIFGLEYYSYVLYTYWRKDIVKNVCKNLWIIFRDIFDRKLKLTMLAIKC